MTEPLLQVQDVTAGFGATTVLHGVSFDVPEGSIAGIFGLNGAGKSVTMKTLGGSVPARSGSVVFRGQDVTKLSPEKRVALGMGHVPQGRQVFPGLTVEENLRLGAYTLRRKDKKRYAGALDSVFDRFPVLAQRRKQAAGTMSGGQQASLAVGRALINEPSLILVDEPSAGLSPVATLELDEVLRSVAETGVTMVLVEQNVAFGLSLVDTAHLMQTGRVVHSSPVAELDDTTLATHLGIGKVLQAATGSALAARQIPAQPRSASRASRS
ncbi:MAG: ABC transporter ATP-binding protein [Actinobacteria bacterium]|nr:ABC transporter ATP-binding protein [Actinomycetota bacterium]MCA1722353.1 ABC transporter ATP-binding protein [Actinomycetota bacterium]